MTRLPFLDTNDLGSTLKIYPFKDESICRQQINPLPHNPDFFNDPDDEAF